MIPLGSACALAGALLAALQLAADDPRWRLRESVGAYLATIQSEREVRIAERLRQVRLHAEFAQFAAGLCLPEPGARLRSLAAVSKLSSSILERRKLRLDVCDTWTSELPDGTFRQHWMIIEHEHVPQASFSLRYVWQENELALVFRGRPTADGGFEVWPEWIEERRAEDRLPPLLSRLLDLLGPDAKMLAGSAAEARR